MVRPNLNTYTMIVKNVDTETDKGLEERLAHNKMGSPLFLHLDSKFDKFIEEWGQNNDLEEKYYSDEAIYTKKGAIIQAIEHIFEVMDEEKLSHISTDSPLLDFEGQWAG